MKCKITVVADIVLMPEASIDLVKNAMSAMPDGGIETV
jgi:hypothetical protein